MILIELERVHIDALRHLAAACNAAIQRRYGDGDMIDQMELRELRDLALERRVTAIGPDFWGSEENMDATLDAVAEALGETTDDDRPDGLEP